jgi:hypothetical protein
MLHPQLNPVIQALEAGTFIAYNVQYTVVAVTTVHVMPLARSSRTGTKRAQLFAWLSSTSQP